MAVMRYHDWAYSIHGRGIRAVVRHKLIWKALLLEPRQGSHVDDTRSSWPGLRHSCWILTEGSSRLKHARHHALLLSPD